MATSRHLRRRRAVAVLRRRDERHQLRPVGLDRLAAARRVLRVRDLICKRAALRSQRTDPCHKSLRGREARTVSDLLHPDLLVLRGEDRVPAHDTAAAVGKAYSRSTAAKGGSSYGGWRSTTAAATSTAEILFAISYSVRSSEMSAKCQARCGDEMPVRNSRLDCLAAAPPARALTGTRTGT